MNAVENVARVVLDVSWRGSWAILILIALRWFVRDRLPARFLFLGWIVVAIRLLLPVSFGSPLSPFHGDPFAVHGEVIYPGEDWRSDLQGGVPANLAAVKPVLAARPFTMNTEWRDPLQGMALIWMTGAGTLLLAHAWARIRFNLKLRRSRADLESAASRRLATVIGEAAARGVEFVVTDAVSSPALYGIWFPRLVFPRALLEQLSPEDIHHVVRHELAHYSRKDLISLALLRAAIVVHWFNPLVWIMAGLARDDCELACDEWVVRDLTPVEREAYGSTLLRTLKLTNFQAKTPVGLGVVTSKQKMKRRIQLIVAPTVARLGAAVFAGTLFSTFVLLSLTRELRAETSSLSVPAVPAASTSHAAVVDASNPGIVYNASVDGLDAVFPGGVVMTMGSKTITVADIRREAEALVPQLIRESKDQADFKIRLDRLQNDIVKNLVERDLLVREFRATGNRAPGEPIAPAEVDKSIEAIVDRQFAGDREKFLAYIRDRGFTVAAYRREMEDDLIYSRAKAQQRKVESTKKAVKPPEPWQVHLRIIQIARDPNQSDNALLEKTKVVLERFHRGESFASLAREYSVDTRAARGGDWGWVGPSELKASYAGIVSGLKKGEVSAPQVAEEGIFLLYVDDRR